MLLSYRRYQIEPANNWPPFSKAIGYLKWPFYPWHIVNFLFLNHILKTDISILSLRSSNTLHQIHSINKTLIVNMVFFFFTSQPPTISPNINLAYTVASVLQSKANASRASAEFATQCIFCFCHYTGQCELHLSLRNIINAPYPYMVGGTPTYQ